MLGFWREFAGQRVPQADATYRPPLWQSLKAAQRIRPDDVLKVLEIHAPPVPLDAICQGLGVEVCYDEELAEGVAGVLDTTKEPARISVRHGDHPHRQRFTVAHEIGHLLLHDFGVAHRDTSFRDPVFGGVETQANQFAASLLMPAWMVYDQMRKTARDEYQLAERFLVSEEAMHYRLKNLGL